MNLQLEMAYQQAWYHFWWKGCSERIHPGQRLDLLEPLLQHSSLHWVWITAANPGSRRYPTQENHWRNGLLQQGIQRLQRPFGPAWSGSDRGDWPVEAGFWLVTDQLEPVIRLARHAGQLALLLGSRTQPAHIHGLRPILTGDKTETTKGITIRNPVHQSTNP